MTRYGPDATTGLPVDILTPGQVTQAWEHEGGDAGAVRWAVSVCSAESSRNRYAVSPAGARGLWQIMPFNFAWTGLTWENWFDARANARAAIKMSGNGQNWAAWDSAYADISKSGRYKFLARPEENSAAWNEYARIYTGSQPAHVVRYPALPGTSAHTADSYAAHVESVVNDWKHHTRGRLAQRARAWHAVGRGRIL